MTSQRRRCTILGLTLIALLLAAAPAHAQTPTTIASSSEPFVVLTGRIDVPLGDKVTDAVIFNGPVTIEGTVDNNVVAFNGDVTVSGSVGGDVVSLNGDVTVTSGAHVGGNVQASGAATVAPGTVSGTVGTVTGLKAGDVSYSLLGRLLMWIIATCSSLILGLALTLWIPKTADALEATSRQRLGASIGYGAAWFFGLPVVGLVLFATVLAGLIGLGILLGLVLIDSFAYATGVFLIGRRILPAPRGRFVSFLAAWAILRMVALVPGLGGLMWTLTVIFGLGAIAITGWRAARGKPAAASAPAPALMPGSLDAGGIPPVPPMPS